MNPEENNNAVTSIDQDLTHMQQVAYRAAVYSRLHRTRDQIAKSSSMDILGMQKKPRPARAEVFTTDENVTSLRKEVNEISNWVLEQNQDATKSPDYDGIDDSTLSAEDKKNIFWFRKDNLTVTADKESHPKSVYKLDVFFTNEHGKEVELSFNHDGTFNLNIDFIGKSSRYDTGDARLNEMTPEEYRVISYYLDQVKQKTIGPQSKV